jgi:hypothetical protein
MAFAAARKGDIIFADRGLYKHYGVYNGEKSVIHFSPDSGKEINPQDAYIRETSLAEFLKGDDLQVDRDIKPSFPPDEVVRRARRFVNTSRGDYHLLFFNCEHFATWCATGELESKQVANGVVIAGAVVAATAAAVLVVKVILDSDGEDGLA